MRFAFLLLALTLASASAQRGAPRLPPGVDLKRDLPYAGTDNPRQTLHLLSLIHI